MTPLCELAKKYGTDKGGKHYQAGDTCHEYTPIYWSLFHDEMENVERVLEVGVAHGCSLRMWEEFFPNATIVGLDHNRECLRHTAGRVSVRFAEQGDDKSLESAVAKDDQFDLIVDDGSHELYHQIHTMLTFLPYLSKNGLYVIEDLTYDCKPELVTEHIPKEYAWAVVPCEYGLGKARCECGCGGPEQLVIITREP